LRIQHRLRGWGRVMWAPWGGRGRARR
jgi:hypothetical protein